jgi:predicted RNase H-like HicB family nuclease
MTLYTYPITVEREGRQCCAYSDDFPSIYGLGKTVEKAKESILKAMGLYIAYCRKSNKQVPVPRTVYSETVTIAMD